jgi:hypothetical protein
MVFNIGSQKDGVFNNVAGNQNVGNQRAVTVATLDDARTAAHTLRALLQTAHPSVAETVRDDLDAADGELARPEPDRSRVADRLRRITEVVVSGGALAAAGVALGSPLITLAGWLGPLGDPIRRLLA